MGVCVLILIEITNRSVYGGQAANINESIFLQRLILCKQKIQTKSYIFLKNVKL